MSAWRLIKWGLVLGVLAWAVDFLLRTMGEAANHGSWDGQ